MLRRKLSWALLATLLTCSLSGALPAAPAPKAFVQKDLDPAQALLGIPWTATREEAKAKWTKAGLKSIEDSKFSLSFFGTVNIGGNPIPKVLVSYSYTPEGKLKEIHIVSDAAAHPQWRKAGIGSLGTALVESKKDGWPGSKLYYHFYWWPLKKYTVLLQYNTINPDPAAPYDSDSHLTIEIHGTGLSQADLNSPLMAKAVPRND